MNKIIITVVVIIALGLIGGGLYMSMQQSGYAPSPGYEETSPSTPPAAYDPSQASPGTEASTTTVKEFAVNGKNFSFSPSTLMVKKGDIVKITFKNTGGMHDFRIDEFNAETQKLNDGAQETIQFTASKTGSFEYYCSVGTHRAMGMKGVLIVQ